MKRLRIFPEMCARTRLLFASATRNMVPGSTVMMVPSSSMAFSEFTMSYRLFDAVGDAVSISCLFGRSPHPLQTNRSTGDDRRRDAARRKNADVAHADALRSQLMRGR